MKIIYLTCLGMALMPLSPALAQSACEASGPLTIVSATDDGLYEETHGPENTIDGDFDPDWGVG